MIREAELDEVRKKAVELKNMNVARQIENTVDPTGSLRTAFEVEPTKRAETPASPPPPETSAMPSDAPAPAEIGHGPAGASASSPATPAPAGGPAEPEKRA
jgi:sec-independent protein translocase protein TatB